MECSELCFSRYRTLQMNADKPFVAVYHDAEWGVPVKDIRAL